MMVVFYFLCTLFLVPFSNLLLAPCAGDQSGCQKFIGSDRVNNLTQGYVLCSKEEMLRFQAEF